MKKIFISGCLGAMGKVLQSIISGRDDCKIVAGFDVKAGECKFPIYHSFECITEDIDVIIDFSHPSCFYNLFDFALSKNIPVVVCTTGLTPEMIADIQKYSKKIPVFFSSNMSLGVNLICELCKTALSVLGDDFDIEIIEQHHNQKLDAPSGTALMVADEINKASNNKYHYTYDRHSVRQKRDSKEIGIHSIRGGTIVGEHEVIFAGKDEVVTISHSARSKEVFAVGAINASLYLSAVSPGLYNMKDLIGDKKHE